jgi:hypothetical protein
VQFQVRHQRARLDAFQAPCRLVETFHHVTTDIYAYQVAQLENEVDQRPRRVSTASLAA